MLVYYYLLLIVLIILLFNYKQDLFISRKTITLSSCDKETFILDYNDIFPLKKYPFYNYYIYGPNNINYLFKYYGSDILNTGVRKYGPQRNIKFKLNNNKPANLFDISKNIKKCNKNTTRCEFTNNTNYIIPPCCAKHLSDLLKNISTLFETNNITYFIYWGTLLGSIRHGGIIPWDTDIDLYIMKKHVTKFKTLKKNIESFGYKLEKSHSNLYRIFYSKTNKLHIDIYIASNSN